jgi:hypothetical protein
MPYVPLSHVTTGQLTTAAMWNDIVDGLNLVYSGTDWINETFSAGAYTANGAMTWTVQSGDMEVARYAQVGNKTILFQLGILTTTIGGTPNTRLQRAVFGGVAARTSGGVGQYSFFNNNLEGMGSWFASGSIIEFAHDHFTNSNWVVTGTNNVHLRCAGFYSLP